MAKDPAFLFYSNDFISGTYTMTDEQVGKYIRLLCIQHQKVRLTLSQLKKLSNDDPEIMSKFSTETINNEIFYFNDRLRIEADKRKNYTESRRNNLNSKSDIHINTDINPHMKTHMGKHMENENEDVNKDINIIENESKKNKKEGIEIFEKPKTLHALSIELFCNFYQETKGIKYIFQSGKDGTAIKSVIKSIKAICSADKQTDEDVLKAFNYMLQNINDNWVIDNLSISILNSKFNQIISQIKNGKLTESNGKGFDARKNTWFTGVN